MFTIKRNNMKAFLIDVEAQKVVEIQLNTWKDIAPTIGNDCTIFTTPVTFDNNDTLYSDDEGLLKEFYGGIMMEDWAYRIVGNCILQGTDEDGDPTDPIMTKEELEAMIIWMTKDECMEYHGEQYF